MSWGAGGAAAPRVGQNNFFSGNRAIVRAVAKKMKNNILKIINEKYQKYKYKCKYKFFSDFPQSM